MTWCCSSLHLCIWLPASESVEDLLIDKQVWKQSPRLQAGRIFWGWGCWVLEIVQMRRELELWLVPDSDLLLRVYLQKIIVDMNVWVDDCYPACQQKKQSPANHQQVEMLSQCSVHICRPCPEISWIRHLFYSSYVHLYVWILRFLICKNSHGFAGVRHQAGSLVEGLVQVQLEPVLLVSPGDQWSYYRMAKFKSVKSP